MLRVFKIDVLECPRCHGHDPRSSARGIGGALLEASAWTMKHPPTQMRDDEARQRLERWIAA